MSNFTSDWFTSHAQEWLSRIDAQCIRALEVGSYEGRSTLWLLENLLVHPSSSIVCIDSWDGEDKTLGTATISARARFEHNVSPHKNKVTQRVGKSLKLLAEANIRGEQFDLIFIDGDHEGLSALTDILLGWPLLLSGGWLVFDDYRWDSPLLRSQPHHAWDAFVSVKPEGLKWEVGGRLVFARKE